jgi:hypothetical protein
LEFFLLGAIDRVRGLGVQEKRKQNRANFQRCLQNEEVKG